MIWTYDGLEELLVVVPFLEIPLRIVGGGEESMAEGVSPRTCSRIAATWVDGGGVIEDDMVELCATSSFERRGSSAPMVLDDDAAAAKDVDGDDRARFGMGGSSESKA